MEVAMSGLQIASCIVRNDLDEICPNYRLKRYINKSFKRVKLDKLNIEKELNKLKELEKEVEYVLYKPFKNDKNFALLYLLESPNCTELFELLTSGDTPTKTKAICMLLFILENRVYNTNMMLKQFKESNNEINLVKNILNLVIRSLDSIFVNDDVIINYSLRLIFECIKRLDFEYLSRFLSNFNLYKYLNKCHVTTHSDINFTILKLFSPCFESVNSDVRGVSGSSLNLDGMEVSLRMTFSSVKSLLSREDGLAREGNRSNLNGKRESFVDAEEPELGCDKVDLYYSNGKVKLAIILLLGVKGVKLQKDLLNLIFHHFKNEHYVTQLVITQLSVCYLNKFYNKISNEENEKKSLDYLVNNINNCLLQFQKMESNLVKSGTNYPKNDESSSSDTKGIKLDEGVINIEASSSKMDVSVVRRVVRRIFSEFIIVLNGNLEDKVIVNLLLKYEMWFVNRELDELYRINEKVYKDYVNQINVGSATNNAIFVEIMVKYMSRGYDLPEYVTKSMLNSFLSSKSLSLLNNVFKLFIKIVNKGKGRSVLPDIKTIINLNPVTIKSTNEEVKRYELESMGNWLELLYRSNFSGSKSVYDPLKLFKIPQIEENYTIISRYLLGFFKNRSNKQVDEQIIALESEQESVTLNDEEAERRIIIDINLMGCIYHLGINDSLIVNNLQYKCLKLILSRYVLVNSIVTHSSEGLTESNDDEVSEDNRGSSRLSENKLLRQYNSKLRYYLTMILSNVVSVSGTYDGSTNALDSSLLEEEKLGLKYGSDLKLNLQDYVLGSEDITGCDFTSETGVKRVSDEVVDITVSERTVKEMEAYLKSVNSVFISNVVMVIYSIIIKSNIQLLYPVKPVKGFQTSGMLLQQYKCLNCILNGYFHGNVYLKLMLEILLQVSKRPEVFDGNLKYYRCFTCNEYYVNLVGLFESKYEELQILGSDLVNYNENSVATDKNKLVQKKKEAPSDKEVENEGSNERLSLLENDEASEQSVPDENHGVSAEGKVSEKNKDRVLIGDKLKLFNQYVNKILIYYVKDSETREYLKMQVFNLVNHLQSPLDSFTAPDTVVIGSKVVENRRVEVYKMLVHRLCKLVIESRSNYSSKKGGLSIDKSKSEETRTNMLLSHIESIINKLNVKKEKNTDEENKLLDYVYYYVVKLIETNEAHRKVKNTLKPHREETYDIGLLSDYLMNKHKTLSRQFINLLSIALILGEDGHNSTGNNIVLKKEDNLQNNESSHSKECNNDDSTKICVENENCSNSGNESRNADGRKESNRKLILLMILVNNNRELQELIVGHRQTFKLLVSNLQRLRCCGDSCTFFSCNLTLLYFLLELLYMYLRSKCRVRVETKVENEIEASFNSDLDSKIDEERNSKKHRRLMAEMLYSDWFMEKCELIMKGNYYYLGHSIESKLYLTVLKIMYFMFFTLKYDDTRKMDKERRKYALKRYYIMFKNNYKCTYNSDDIVIKLILYKIIKISNTLEKKRKKVSKKESVDDFEFYLKLLDINHFKLVQYPLNVNKSTRADDAGRDLRGGVDSTELRGNRECHGSINNWLIYNKALVFRTLKGGDLGQLRLNVTLYSHNNEDHRTHSESEVDSTMTGSSGHLGEFKNLEEVLDHSSGNWSSSEDHLELGYHSTIGVNGVSVATNDGDESSRSNKTVNSTGSTVTLGAGTNVNGTGDVNECLINSLESSNNYYYNSVVDALNIYDRNTNRTSLGEEDALICKMNALGSRLHGPEEVNRNEILCSLMMPNYYKYDLEYLLSYVYKLLLIQYYSLTSISNGSVAKDSTNDSKLISSNDTDDGIKDNGNLNTSELNNNNTSDANSINNVNNSNNNNTSDANSINNGNNETIDKNDTTATTSDKNKGDKQPQPLISKRRYEFDTVHVNINNVVKLVLFRLMAGGEEPLLKKIMKLLSRVNTDTHLKYILYHFKENSDLDELVHVISLFNTVGQNRDKRQSETDKRVTELDRLILKSNISNLSHNDTKELMGKVNRVLMNSLLDGETQLFKVVKILHNLSQTNRELFKELYLDNYIAALKSSNSLSKENEIFIKLLNRLIL